MSRIKDWFLLFRPWSYTATLIPFLVGAALARGVVEKRGSWISYGTEQLGQGTMATMEFLKSHPEVTAEIVEKVKTTPLLPGGVRKK